MRIRRARAERFGAIVQTEAPPAVVAIDRALARKLGVEPGDLWTGADPGLDVAALTAPTEVHLAVTDRCPMGCRGCYVDASSSAVDPIAADLEARIRALAELGALSIAFGGGEATLHPDLPRLGELARELGMVPTLTTSGLGIDRERAHALRAFAQINVSHDGVGGGYRGARGVDGERVAERAMECLREAGIPFGVNVVLTRNNFAQLEPTVRHAQALGAVEVQLVRFKPAGRGRLDYLAMRLTDEQVDAIPSLLRTLSQRSSIGLRVDCSMLPFLVGDETISAEDLVRFGVMGCEAGRSLMAVRADGRAAGCSFWREDEGDDLVGAWESGAGIEGFRARYAAAPEPCASCPHRGACRGGCRVVASFVGGDPSRPDPECPRVRRWSLELSRSTGSRATAGL